MISFGSVESLVWHGLIVGPDVGSAPREFLTTVLRTMLM